MKKLVPLQLEIEVILNSGLLLEDDSHFLENLALPIDVISTKPLWTELSLLHGILVCGTMFMWKKEVIHGLFPLYYLFLAAEHFLSNWYFSVQRTRMSGAVKGLLSCCKDLYLLQKKSLHFVQENELLFRGFTLAKTSSSALRLESSLLPCLAERWYVMSGLRVSIFHSTFEAINVLQNATQTLVMMCPLSGQLDRRNHYAAYLTAEEMGIEGLDTAENTEFPLEILKKLHQVYVLLQSEFLRRLALCFLMKFWKNMGQNILPVSTLVIDVSAKCSECFSNLNQDYKYFSCYGLNAINEYYSKIPKRNSWRYYGAYVGIHSARLHLQGMLHRTKEMEELLETQTDETEVADIDTLSKNVTNVLTDVITEICSCKSCLEVAVNQLTILNQPAIPHSTPKTSDLLTENSSKQTQEPIEVGFTDLDPQVEDEVFEAVISHDNLGSGSEDEGDSSVTLDAIDQVKRQMTKECSARMLLELKTVLVHKSQEWEKREAKALKNKVLRSARMANIEDRGDVESSGIALQFDCEHDIVQEINGEESETAGGYVSQGEQSGEGKIVGSAPETVEVGSNVVSDDPFISLVMKPEENWPLPRFGRGKTYSSLKSGSSLVPSSNAEIPDFRAEQVKTLIVGAATVQPKYLVCNTDEETFSDSGDDCSCNESENNEQ
ncbi:uncharacterized protein LOC111868200 isoform X2 [Cryptotermes secundus]|nr:uncharacterized protein LOC111868200 isoform X2 [Cryptotermes secundus]